MHQTGTLYLLPVPITENGGNSDIPTHNIEVVSRLTVFIAEDAKAARRNLKRFGYPDISAAEINILNEHTPAEEAGLLLAPLLQGKDVGLMSDAGCPGIADPGAVVVSACHRKNIRVIPLVGPSSIVLAVMASGALGIGAALSSAKLREGQPRE